MGFPEDLLQQAYDLAEKGPGEPNQASLRRAVSTAYYALFHFLIDEVVTKWAVERQRSVLARTFDHGKMKKTCEEVLGRAKAGAPVLPELKNVAQAFVQLQQSRHTADYDNSEPWSRTDALSELAVARQAFASWHHISAKDAAQDFLLQLFLPKLPRG